MKTFPVLIGLCVAFESSAAEQNAVAACTADQVSIPIEYRFKDLDVQHDWIYRSLRATLEIDGTKLAPRDMRFKDGGETLSFCAPLKTVTTAQMLLHVGPMVLAIEPRPIVRDATKLGRMAPIRLEAQPRPNWVVVKSATRLAVVGESLGVFEVELMNFGSSHAGGDVRYLAQDTSGHCAFPSPTNKVIVGVSISGQRVKITSADPDYPEDVVERQGTLERNVNQCAGNYKLDAPLGKTGILATGPTRIRYALRPSTGGGSDAKELARYFRGTFRLQVSGDDIWSADDAFRP